MAIYDPETKEFHCECGCSEVVNYPFQDWLRGHWNRTAEGRDKMSASKIGTVISDEARKNMREEQARRRREEPEIFDKISRSRSSLCLSAEERERKSKVMVRVYKDDPTIGERISASHMGQIREPFSDEHRRNMSEAKKEYYLNNPGVLYGAATGRFSRPTRTESQLDEWLQQTFPGKWKYVGNGEVWIGRKNPDFINVDGKKAVIELFGEYFHNDCDPTSSRSEEGTIAHYRGYGFNCLIVWANYPDDLVLEWATIVEWIGGLR